MLVLLNRELIIKVLNYLLQILKLCLLFFCQCIRGWGIVFDISFLLSLVCDADFGLNTLDSELVL